MMIEGKMEDDATVKQCRVMVELARKLAENAALREAYWFSEADVAGAWRAVDRLSAPSPRMRPRRDNGQQRLNLRNDDVSNSDKLSNRRVDPSGGGTC